MDKFSKKKRSEIMGKIRCKRTKPEIKIHNLLKGNRIRHKMWPKIPGNPDIIVGGKVIIFINGCFWHGCKRHFRMPKTNRKFWGNKIKNNINKQKKSKRILNGMKYRVVVVWEHDTNDKEKLKKLIKNKLL